jgi:Undecaprenyl-phosphate glucose phosphotransferase
VVGDKQSLVKNPNLLFRLSLAVLDAILIALAFYLGYRLRLLSAHQNLPYTFTPYLGMAVIYVLTMLTTFFFARLYHRHRTFSHIDEFSKITAASSIGTLIAIAFFSLIFKNEPDYSRLMMVYVWLLTIIFTFIGRTLHARWQRSMYAKGIGASKVLIVGAGEVGRIILQKIMRSPGLGYKVVGFVDDNVNGQIMGVPVLGKVSDLPSILAREEVDEVIIAMPEADHSQILSVIGMCDRSSVAIKVFPDVFQIIASEVSIGDLDGFPLITIRDMAMRGWKLTLKRAMDVIGASIALILLSPLMLLIAILIKLDSPGPVFYVQERMGLDAKPFPMLKFRSMRQDADANGPGWTTPDDPRRTRLGAILRRYSLDELPQFINVLLGHMSLVGPRPEQPYYVEQFRKSIPRYMERHREKAGITGWAQIHGLRGDTSIAERTKYDLWYIENWSLWLDIKIIIKTLVRIFSDRSAY